MIYREMIKKLLKQSDKIESSKILTSLLNQDGDAFEYNLSQYLLTAFSHFDVEKRGHVEKIYHAFILGLMAHLSNKFVLKSNPETGLGRADLLIYSPKESDKRGWVLEFKAKKVYHKVTLQEKAKEALDQIKDSKYITLLKEHNKTELMLMGIAFDGKEVACEVELSK